MQNDSRQAGTDGSEKKEDPDKELVREISRMVTEWEDSDELSGAFAVRLIRTVREFRRTA